MGQELVLRALHLVLQRLARPFLVLGQVVATPSSDPLELRLSERELEGDVGAGAGVVGQLVVGVYLSAQQLLTDADRFQPIGGPLDPLFEGLLPLVISRWDEVLNLHLLKLPGPEDEVAGGDLVAEGLADLGDSKGQLDAGSVDDVLEVGEDALGGLGAEVRHSRCVREGAHLGLEHEVELPGGSEGARGAGGGGGDQGQLLLSGLCHLLQLNWLECALLLGLLLHLLGLLLRLVLHVPGLQQAEVPQHLSVLLHLHLGEEQLVRPVSVLGLLAVHHGVGKPIHVTRGLPDGRRSNDR
mmetsp:Transcript_19604/g.28288  ORF Transcript_19604/g.28288 Transcript_19604/m.28288 type:complete len:298 (-) Transcript_19604:401-1294(-)